MSETLYQSIVLTVVGMAIIFAFMGLLIVLVNVFVAIATRFFPDREEEESSGSPSSGVSGNGGDGTPDDGVVAAIAGALRSKDR